MAQDDITLVSSTDSDEDVAAALTGVPATPKAEEKPAAEKPAAAAPAAEPPAATPATPAAATPATPETPAAGEEETPAQKIERERQSSRERRKAKIQSEFDVAVAKREQARNEARAEEQRLADLKRQTAELEAKARTAATATTPPDPVAALGPKPMLQDLNPDGSAKYTDYELWVADISKWHAENARLSAEAVARAEADRTKKELTSAERARIERDSAFREQQNVLADYRAKTEAFKAAAPDFDAVLEGAREFVEELIEERGPDVMNVVDRYATADAEHGPAIVHFLAQNPGELRRITALPVAQQIAALGRLDERVGAALKQPARPPAVPVTRAPEPMKPVGGTPTASTVSPEDEDYRVYADRRNKLERERAASMAR